MDFQLIQSFIHQPLPFVERIWNFFQSFQLNYFWTSFVVIAIVPMVWFYIYGLFFYYIDMVSSESFKHRYKVQNNIRITSQQYAEALYISLRNWFVLGFPYLYFICTLNESSYITNRPVLPTIGVFFRDLIVFVLIEEFMFYFSHRALHWTTFYAPIHKFHHKFTAPCAIAAVYAHPIEHMLSNVIPVAMGPLIMQSHPITSMFWGILALFNTMTVHSGYDFTSFIIFPSPYFHDWHHEKFNENFGATELLDRLFQTNKQYMETIRKGEMFAPRKKYDNKTN